METWTETQRVGNWERERNSSSTFTLWNCRCRAAHNSASYEIHQLPKTRFQSTWSNLNRPRETRQRPPKLNNNAAQSILFQTDGAILAYFETRRFFPLFLWLNQRNLNSWRFKSTNFRHVSPSFLHDAIGVNLKRTTTTATTTTPAAAAAAA